MAQNIEIELLDEINAVADSGDMEKFLELSKKMPVPPEVAMAFKKGFGTEFLTNSGFNLSEAEKTYGKNWLSS